MATQETALEMIVEVDKNNWENKEGKILIEYLENEDIKGFINFKDGNIEDLVNYTEEKHTLLQMCCEKNLAEAVIHLLNKGADYEAISPKNKSKPIIIAVEESNTEIFKALFDKYTQILELPDELPNIIILHKEISGIHECYDIFYSKLVSSEEDEVSFIINRGDKDGITPLHYAVMLNNAKTIIDLFCLGASLGTKNNNGIMPIQYLEPEILKNFLDEYTKFDIWNKKTKIKDFRVTFYYGPLVPPFVQLKNKNKLNTDAGAPSNCVERKLVAETEVLQYMAKRSEWKELLTHPMITSFLHLKWLQMKWIFWLNLAFYIIFAGSLLTYFFIDVLIENHLVHSICIQILQIIIITGALGMMLRELSQLFLASAKYFRNFENYIEILLVVLSVIVAYDIYCSNAKRKDVFAVTILLVAFEFILMLGHHPTFSTNVLMFRKVSYNYFIFFIWYSLPIIAFAVSFNLVLSTNSDNNTPTNNTHTNNTYTNNTHTNSARGDDNNPFNDIPQSVFKTVVMVTGEFDYSNLKFAKFPLTSRLIFVAFVFTISIILLNLLNGSAVSDIQMIRNHAEVLGYVSRIEFFTSIESRLIGIPIVEYAEKLIKLCVPSHISRDWNYSLRLGQFLSYISCLFPYLDYELTFYPKNGGLIEQKPQQKRYVNVCLDKYTVLRTNNLFIKKREIDEIKLEKANRENYNQRIENQQKIIENQQKVMANKIKLLLEHVGCLDDDTRE